MKGMNSAKPTTLSTSHAAARRARGASPRAYSTATTRAELPAMPTALGWMQIDEPDDERGQPTNMSSGCGRSM